MKKSEDGYAYSFAPIFKVIEFALQISFVTKAFANKMRLSLKKRFDFRAFVITVGGNHKNRTSCASRFGKSISL